MHMLSKRKNIFKKRDIVDIELRVYSQIYVFILKHEFCTFSEFLIKQNIYYGVLML